MELTFRRFAALILLLLPALPIRADTISGTVRDPSTAVLTGARVSLQTGRHVPVARATTDKEGRFQLDVPPGSYILNVSADGLAPRSLAARSPSHPFDITLTVLPQVESVTVTASIGLVDEAQSSPQSVNVVSREAVEERASTVLAQVANEEPGLALQRTSSTVGGIFVRGLTGNKVNVFIDGVRYSTMAQRGGINTFFNLMDPAAVEGLEVLRGPDSAQYGSDAIGGSVQVLSPTLRLDRGQRSFHGSWSVLGNTADGGFGSSASTTFAIRNVAVLTSLAGHRVNTLRTGGGIDSHAAVTRFLGLPSTAIGNDRLPDTAFTQYGGLLRVQWAPASDVRVTGHYNRSQQDGGRRYDQLLGGDGNLVADLRNLMLDFGYLRLEKWKAGPLSGLTLTGSYNAQREERVNQGGAGNPRANLQHEHERTAVYGVQGQAGYFRGSRHALQFGGDFYRERIASSAFQVSPVTNVSSLSRGRVPDGATYRHGGGFIQHSWEMVPRRLHIANNLRVSGAAYQSLASRSPLANGQPLWPDDSLTAYNASFRSGGALEMGRGFAVTGTVSRGFRAPHITDLGTLGLTGSGFEVAAPDIAGLQGIVGSTADAGAQSTGIAVTQLMPETSLAYDAGVRYRNRRVSGELTWFLNDIFDSITRQTLLLPPGAVGTQLGGQPITAQSSSGAVFVALSPNPVLVRANFGDARIRGWEGRLKAYVTHSLLLSSGFTTIHAEEVETGLPPNIEGGTPATNGYLKLRWQPTKQRFWLEPYVLLAGRQERLSSLDLSDRRTGGARSRSSISSFFRNGATARGLVQDSRLVATGETLAQVQDRVLGPGVNSAPLFNALPGYATFNLRAGFQVTERHRLMVEMENLGDRNYRGISWGMDAPGRGVYVRYAVDF